MYPYRRRALVKQRHGDLLRYNDIAFAHAPALIKAHISRAARMAYYTLPTRYGLEKSRDTSAITQAGMHSAVSNDVMQHKAHR